MQCPPGCPPGAVTASIGLSAQLTTISAQAPAPAQDRGAVEDELPLCLRVHPPVETRRNPPIGRPCPVGKPMNREPVPNLRGSSDGSSGHHPDDGHVVARRGECPGLTENAAVPSDVVRDHHHHPHPPRDIARRSDGHWVCGNRRYAGRDGARKGGQRRYPQDIELKVSNPPKSSPSDPWSQVARSYQRHSECRGGTLRQTVPGQLRGNSDGVHTPGSSRRSAASRNGDTRTAAAASSTGLGEASRLRSAHPRR